MSGASTQEAGDLARFRAALSHLWLPYSHGDARLAQEAAHGLGSQVAPPPGEPGAGDRVVLFTPDGQALCAWRLLEPCHAICTAFHCADAYRGLVHPAALIWGAEVWVWERWPHARLTVRLRRSPQVWPDAGSFFVQAGWKEEGIDAGGRVLLARQPIWTRREP